MPSPARSAAQQRLAEIGGALSGANTDITSLEGTIGVKANTFYLVNTRVLERAGQYTVLYASDDSQMIAGGAPGDGTRYMTGDEFWLRTKAFGTLARFSAAGLAINGNITPTIDNAYTFGSAAFRAAAIFATTGAVSTSDARDKLDRDGGELVDDRVSTLTPAEIAWGVALGDELGIYIWRASRQEKGQGARLHVGMTVQRAIALAEQHGLDAFRYGFICHDSWKAVETQEAEYVDVPNGEKDEAGEPVTVRTQLRPATQGHPAGERYGFRYDELDLFIRAAERAARKAA